MGAQWKAKHKDIAAIARGRLFGKLVKDIMIAARNGADPDLNPSRPEKRSSPQEEARPRWAHKGTGRLKVGQDCSVFDEIDMFRTGTKNKFLLLLLFPIIF